MSWGDLLRDLQEQGRLDPARAERIAEHLHQHDEASTEPWFIQALLAVGAWVAAICFIVFLAIANLLDDTPSSLLLWGAGLLVTATCLRNLARHVFFVQFALALSVMGHACVLYGAARLFPNDHGASVAVAATILCIALYLLYRDATHRFLSCLLASACLTAWIARADVAQLIHVLILAKVVLTGIVFMYRTDLVALRPLGYAMALSMPGNLLLVIVPDAVQTPWWPANVVLAAALGWLYYWIVEGERRRKGEPLLVAVIATLALSAVATPGVLAAIGLMVLGYARRDATLLGIGITFFPIFIVVFYYELETTLLVKSWIMAATGGVLLATRAYLTRRQWTIEE